MIKRIFQANLSTKGNHKVVKRFLVKLAGQRVGSSTPPGKSEGKTNGLEQGSNNASKHNVNWLLLNNDVVDDSRSSGDEEDEATEVGSTLVSEGAGEVQKSADTVGLGKRADKRAAVDDSGALSLLRLQSSFGVARVLGLFKKGAKDWEVGDERGGMSVDSADGKSRGLNRRPVVDRHFGL